MIGRTPAAITAVRPLRHGVIADFEVTEQMLRHFIGRVHRSRLAHPRVMICAPSGITDVEQRALMEASLAAGARSVHLIEESLAAAIGAGLAIGEPRASVVVDVGGGTSEVAVISLGGIVVSRSLRTGGYDLDETVAAWLRNTHGLAIGETTSERVKLDVGGVNPDTSDATTAVRGRDPVSGLPREVIVTSEEMRRALEPPVADIIAAVKEALEETPPELASDISERGMLLAGGGALLRGFRARLEMETNVPVVLADSPLTCVAEGAGQALDEIELLERMSAGAHSRGASDAARSSPDRDSGEHRALGLPAGFERREVLLALDADLRQHSPDRSGQPPGRVPHQGHDGGHEQAAHHGRVDGDRHR